MTLSPPSPEIRTEAAGSAVSPPRASRGIALVVDDEPTNRRLLARMLKKEGFDEVMEASGGEQAIAQFQACRPDIVFMDIMMPQMDGFEATRRIKALAGMDFVPVIFLTALHDEQSLVRCTESGGDDFLTKPFNFSILKARIVAMERVRDLQRTIAAKNRALAQLLEKDRQEQTLAERIFSRAVNQRNVATERLQIVQRSAATFNGDLLLTQHLPDGGLRILLGDFTGHGLAAAIGALPVSDAFRTMTRKGLDDEQVLEELNRKLHEMLPADRFMAACLITLPGGGGELRWWNGGMPSAWLRTREGLRELSSHAMPLGILPSLPARECPRRVPMNEGDHLLLMSDGLLEARNAEGVQFLDAGFDRVLSGWSWNRPVLPTLCEALDRHCDGAEPEDDVAVVEVPLDGDLFQPRPVEPQEGTHTPRGGWTWSLVLEDERLGDLPSVGSVLRGLGLLEGLEDCAGALETIVNELYSNALEHGILKLHSPMKAHPEGFASYYQRRAERLEAGPRGRVEIRIAYEPGEEEAGAVRIRISDTGEGFDAEAWQPVAQDPARPWGRGIALVRSLCESVEFDAGGSRVEAVYRCT
ncbi:Histidine kinase-like ATPase domain-containing protein [Ectothiorhodospira mobilis]|uniref:Histidine kinase-like ATPase domain-containing protein n=1 Tax=Ectothiorhodospira mobilis TaxID=195064 RepID=A0A1I4PT93_ECTMO|nr:fused response regulator/phosphatase [Ectothiorhodospira mobilis]SFM30997.1 Histidine kinase-like ATPase domain-containing protein [Ectothiorhodospira mobilis]